MVRSRLACVALALGLGVLGGCTCFARPTQTARPVAGPDCGCGNGATIVEGPQMGDTLPPGFTLPPNQGPVFTTPPETAPSPRLVPTPQTAVPPAPPAPYVPR